MSQAIFWITLEAELLAALAVLVSLLFPRHRIWPPARPHSWAGYGMWGLFILSAIGIVALGIVDWGTLKLAWWVRWLLGVPLWLGGSDLALWAMIVLGMAASFGEADTLVRRGPYRFSRNPQYVGFIAGLLGWAWVASSAHALIAALVGVLPLGLVPFAEEPWLLARYGAAYATYMKAVARFVALPHCERRGSSNISTG